MQIESLEPRQLLAADVAVDAARLLFSGVKNKTTSTQTVTIRNDGDSTLKIGTGGIALGGTDKARFSLTAVPTLSKGIAPGKSITVKLAFKPTAAGLKTATLNIKSNDPDQPTLSVPLRGLGTNGLYDKNEPSLQRIFDLFQLPIRSGDTDTATARIDGPADNDAVDMQTLIKAGDGPVTFEMIAAYTGASNPGGIFGWYAPGNLDSKNELFTLPSADVQRINPHMIGAASFDPADQPFALYSSWPTQAHLHAYSENTLNTWEANEAARDKYRFYPLKNVDGSIVENAYIVGIEEAKNSDYQDALIIVRNVKKYIPPVEPPVDPNPPVDPPTDPVDPEEQETLVEQTIG